MRVIRRRNCPILSCLIRVKRSTEVVEEQKKKRPPSNPQEATSYKGTRLSIRCDVRIGLAAAAQHPNCLEIVVAISGAAGGIAVGVKPIGDREGKGGADRLGLAAGQPVVTRLFDNHRLGDQGLKRVTPAVGP